MFIIAGCFQAAKIRKIFKSLYKTNRQTKAPSSNFGGVQELQQEILSIQTSLVCMTFDYLHCNFVDNREFDVQRVGLMFS